MTTRRLRLSRSRKRASTIRRSSASDATSSGPRRRWSRIRSQAAFAGTLKRTPLARVLQRLYAARSSGSLLLLRDNVKKIVSFADGYPFSVRSNLLGECLGQILLEKKLITGEVLSASVARMQREKRQQGQILIEMGALSPYNLQRALVDQVEAKLLEVFAWTDGQVHVQGQRGDARWRRRASSARRPP